MMIIHLGFVIRDFLRPYRDERRDDRRGDHHVHVHDRRLSQTTGKFWWLMN